MSGPMKGGRIFHQDRSGDGPTLLQQVFVGRNGGIVTGSSYTRQCVREIKPVESDAVLIGVLEIPVVVGQIYIVDAADRFNGCFMMEPATGCFRHVDQGDGRAIGTIHPDREFSIFHP